jgi:glucose/arabinose dehydrogenase
MTNLGSGWDMPLGVLFSRDGQKMFVWEKGGKVYVCNRNPATQLYDKQMTPVLDISPEVGNWNDMGCLGFALDPSFESNGLIYVLYIVDRHHLLHFGTPAYDPPPGDNASAQKATIGRVTRYQTSNSGGILVANTATRTVLLGETKKTGVPILYDSHGVGSLFFAADGTLIVSTGDGASYSAIDAGGVAHTYYIQALADSIIRANENVGAFRSQMLNSLSGKLLRIDPATGNGVPSNPFYDAAEPRSAKSRVYALGLRNPYRFSIKPGTGSTNPAAGDIGEIYVGDVGMGTWEDLTVIKEPGMNCGWPLYEGLTSFPEFHTAITDNKDELNPLFGIGGCNKRYFTFQDLLKQATADNNKTVYNPCNPSQPIGTANRFVHRRPLLDTRHGIDITRVGTFTGNLATVATIGTAASGVTGSPYRGNAIIGGFWYTGNLFPANFRNTYFYGDYGRSYIKSLTVNFTDVLQKAEHFADAGSIVSLAENPLDGTMVYVDIGNNLVRRISYGGNQLPVVRMTSSLDYGPSALNVTLTGSNSYDPEGGRLTYSWNFGDGSPISTVANPPVHIFTAPIGTPRKYVVTLTVKDSVNATAIDSIIISVNNTPPVVNITSPVKNSTYNIGLDTVYAFTAIVSDAEHTAGQLKYEWQQLLRHDTHEHPGPVDTVRNTFGSITRIGCNGDEYYWLIRLKVTDAAGLSTTDSSKIYPNCAAFRTDLTLRKFSVSQEPNENVVKWITDIAPQLKRFEVERSVDGINFYSIDHQLASAPGLTKEYSFTDNMFFPGENYYRLKMMEIGNVIKYSATVKTISEAARQDLAVSPNPVAGNFSLRYTASGKGPVIIRLVDLNGRIVHTIHETVNKGENIIYLQDMPAWKPGVYVITVQKGAEMQQVKMLYQGRQKQ